MTINRNNILDELLVLKTQNNDMKAFSLLVKRFQPSLLNHAYRMTKDDEAALDIAQDSWFAIAKGISKLKSPTAFRAWAFRIVSNKSATWIREEQKKRVTSIERNMAIETEASEDENDSIRIIRMAMEELSTKNKTILSMFYINNYTVKEIAEIISLPQGTVKSRLFTARKTLKEKFEQYKTIRK